MPKISFAFYKDQKLKIEQALELKESLGTEFNVGILVCPECGEPLKPHQAGGKSPAHFEHYDRNAKCSISHRRANRHAKDSTSQQHMTFKQAFENHLYENNSHGSGKASSYLKSLEWLQAMLGIYSFGFDDCKDVWSIKDISRLRQLRERVLEEKRKKVQSPWVNDSIPVSYLRDDYCSSALSELIEFIPEHQHSCSILALIKNHQGDSDALANKLNFDPSIPNGYVHDPDSRDGQDRIAEAKTRIGQQAFRKMILENYNGRCCITGLDIPSLNRASHIIGWAEKKETRMDPRNGICLSATYDAAFDKKLISFDEKFRLILSREIREHYTKDCVQQYFQCKAGNKITLPKVFQPMQSYLEKHRRNGNFS